MKSRVLQFLCSVHTIYVALPQWIFFFKLGGQEGGDRTKPCKSSLRELHKDLSLEQIREWIYTVTAPCSSGPQPCSGHPWGFPKAPSGVPKDKNDLHNNTKILFVFFLFFYCADHLH